jgi:signal transduction histidine kinase
MIAVTARGGPASDHARVVLETLVAVAGAASVCGAVRVARLCRDRVALAVALIALTTVQLWWTLTPAGGASPGRSVAAAVAAGAVALTLMLIVPDRFPASPLARPVLVLGCGVVVIGHALQVTAVVGPTAGAVLALAGIGAVLAGVLTELADGRGARGRAAVMGERHRLSRELHDGVAQELAFIRSHAEAIAVRRPDGEVGVALTMAADRALEDLREVMWNLRRRRPGSLAETLEDELGDMARRHGVRLELELAVERAGLVSPDVQHALVSICREAIANAARHGGATVILVRVWCDPERGLRLTVEDDGKGFDPGRRPGGERGFGLQSMRERALAVGGDVHVRSAPGRGTTVDAELA